MGVFWRLQCSIAIFNWDNPSRQWTIALHWNKYLCLWKCVWLFSFILKTEAFLTGYEPNSWLIILYHVNKTLHYHFRTQSVTQTMPTNIRTGIGYHKGISSIRHICWHSQRVLKHMTDIVIEEQKVLLTVIENTEFRLFDLFYYQSIREPVISKN